MSYKLSFANPFFTLVVSLLLIGATLSSPLVQAESATFVEGEHYKALEIPVSTGNADKIEVSEVFSYMCVHCFNFDPFVESWHSRQTEDVDFMRVPASFNGDWELMAQAYYTAITLGVLDSVHMPIFEGLHNEGQDLRKSENLAALFEEKAGISEADFAAAYNSFSVRGRVQQSKAKAMAYRITGVPTMVVNGKYVVDGRMAGGNAKMLEVVDFLVAKERAAATAAAQ